MADTAGGRETAFTADSALLDLDPGREMDADENALPLAFVMSEGGTPAVAYRHLGPWVAERDGPILLAVVEQFASLAERSNRRSDSLFADGRWAFRIEMDHDETGIMDEFEVRACERLQPLGISFQTYCQRVWADGLSD